MSLIFSQPFMRQFKTSFQSECVLDLRNVTGFMFNDKETRIGYILGNGTILEETHAVREGEDDDTQKNERYETAKKEVVGIYNSLLDG